jgi:hypothetical protein
MLVYECHSVALHRWRHVGGLTPSGRWASFLLPQHTFQTRQVLSLVQGLRRGALAIRSRPIVGRKYQEVHSWCNEQRRA